MTLCKHQPHRIIDWIREPKYSTDEVLINTARVPETIEHLLVKFVNCTKYPDWFYLSAKMVRKCKTQKNGSGMVYVVPMAKREDLIVDKMCNH